MRPKIAGHCICKNEEENIGRMLSSIVPYVDFFLLVDTGSTDKTVEIAKNFPHVKVIEAGDKFFYPLYEGGKPIFHFDEAKNFALEQISKDEFPYVFWLDADDELQGGENIPKVLEMMEGSNIHATFLRYLYFVDFDEKGRIKNINIEHLRERIIKNDGTFKWVMPLHETLIEQRQGVLKTDNYDMLVLHHTTLLDMEMALWRNIETIQEVVLWQEGKDPRNIYYLAKTYFDLHDPIIHEYTISLLKQYLLTSGWEEERSQAWSCLALLHLERSELEESISASLMSLKENPYFPDTYVTLAYAYILKRDFQRALHWVRIASQIEIPKTTLVVLPKDLQLKMLDVIWHATLNMGKLDEAEGAIKKLLGIDDKNQEFQARLKLIEDIKRDNALAHSIAKLAFYYKERQDQNKLLATLSAMPDHIREEPSMIALRNDIVPPKKWESNEIAIYCGPSFEKWDYSNLEQGLGGSESAVIYLTRCLAKRGYKITVFGDPSQSEVRDGGVVYKPYFHFDHKDEFNIFISWRQPAIFDLPIKAKKSFVWLHDLPNPADYIPQRMEKINKVIVLSKYHREQLTVLEDERMYISSNGRTP